MPLTLQFRSATTLPIEVDGLLPEYLAAESAASIARKPLAVGNVTAEVGEHFAVSGDSTDGHLIFTGDLRSIRRIGAQMTAGRITIDGDAGNGVGVGLAGGTIEVIGSVGDWAGASMGGGLLRIRGSAGDHLGAALPGARIGMTEGVILVDGAIGSVAGQGMRRGLIAVRGSAGDGLGAGLVAGSIFVFGPIGRRAGFAMKRGTIALFGPRPELLPTFGAACRYRPPFLAIYLLQLRSWNFEVPETAFSGQVEKYNGDLVEGGKGEILLSVQGV